MSALSYVIESHGYSHVPSSVIDRNGFVVDTSDTLWRLNAAAGSADLIDIGLYEHPTLRYAVSRYLAYHIKKSSSDRCSNIHRSIELLLRRAHVPQRLRSMLQEDEFEEILASAMMSILAELRSKNKLYEFFNISRWYLWCADTIPACGFSSEAALAISRVRIPGNVKGMAVRSADPDEGPLHFELEEPLVRRMLRDDRSGVFEHLQQRLAVALALAFGRNSLNYARLREEDLKNLAAGVPGMEDLWVLHIPRIKKRSGPREYFRAEPCSQELAGMILDLIRANQERSAKIKNTSLPRPLFFRRNPVDYLIGTESQEWCFHLRSGEFARLLSAWARRVRLVSPLTGERLHLTPRRLRYTFACNMARQGASKAALAEMLDHTDTQNVDVYYELFDDLVPMLDKALAKKVGSVLKWFKGTVVSSSSDAINGDDDQKLISFVAEQDPKDQTQVGICGETELCALDPPYSCYLCPKFQPYRDADHDHVLDLLLRERELRLSRYENARLGMQLDDVIYAVGQVASECQRQKQ